MPDLNLLDDVGFEEKSAPAPKPQRSKPKNMNKGGGGGGGGTVVLIILIVIILLGGAAYFLNEKGIIKLWGKKTPAVAQVEEEFPPMPQQEQAPSPVPTPQPQSDSAQLALLDTTSASGNVAGSAGGNIVDDGTQPDNLMESEPSVDKQLVEMSGEYTVQVIVFKDKAHAEEAKENLEVAGYPAFVERVQLKGGSWYRVCVGKYPTREDAKKAVETFAPQLQANYVIDKVRQQ
ncbi:MAG: SPOR domain-containing protein [Bacteroidetes bacterium]|nr:SPOR domain-containing protein [Bacteroidota bacterium]